MAVPYFAFISITSAAYANLAAALGTSSGFPLLHPRVERETFMNSYVNHKNGNYGEKSAISVGQNAS